MTRKDRIVEVFEANGCQMSTLRHAQACIAAGVFEEAELNNASIRWAQDQCRKALQEKMADGIPYAGPTPKKDSDGGQMWRQYTLWDYEDAEHILKDRCRALVDDYKPIVALYDHMMQRWGKAPEIPQLVLK